MSAVLIKGSGKVVDGDYKTVSWTGTTKGGKSVTITLANAINLGDIDWTFAEKDDTVPQVVFTSAYTEAEQVAGTTEPWTVLLENGLATGVDSILLGAGVFSIAGTDVALTRGGGSFKVVREFRRINADGDRGAVKGRVVCEGAEATLTFNDLTFIADVPSLYACITTASTT